MLPAASWGEREWISTNSERMVAFYAGRLGVSETHLNRICRAAFGTSALGAITRRLMLEATRDLTFTTMSVKEVAYSLGFEDPAYFTRAFLRATGETPGAFRKRERGQPDAAPAPVNPAADTASVRR